MPFSSHRAFPLTPEQKREFLEYHLPNRVRLVEEAVSRLPQGYYHLTVAAVHGRALAQFLGLKLKKGNLASDNFYFCHDGGDSYEVKIPDVSSQPLPDVSILSYEDRKALEIGFDTINREVAHLTYWATPGPQHAADVAGQPYPANLAARIERFCAVILRETKLFIQRA